MGATSIEWTEHSVNPIRARLGANVGHYCEKVSPGCKNCYSSRFQSRRGLPQFQEQRGENRPEPWFDPKQLEHVLRRRKPTKWFWCDMTDMFGDWVPFEWIAACLGVMAATPHHTHQVLTKRADRAVEFFAWAWDQRCHGNTVTEILRSYAIEQGKYREPDGSFPPGPARALLGFDTRWPLPNLHLGVSVESQDFVHRVADILKCPAGVHWVSAEPLLGPLDLAPWMSTTKEFEDATARALGEISHDERDAALEAFARDRLGAPPGAKITWVVVGGESGNNARPFQLDWGRSLLRQGRDTGCAMFMKQGGHRPLITREEWELGVPGLPLGRRLLSAKWDPRSPEGFVTLSMRGKGGELDDLPADLRVREFPQ